MSNYTILQRYGDGILVRTSRGYACHENGKQSKVYATVKELAEAYKSEDIWSTENAMVRKDNQSNEVDAKAEHKKTERSGKAKNKKASKAAKKADKTTRVV